MQVRPGVDVAVVHDGTGHAVIVSAEPPLGAPSAAGLPLDALASLLQPGEPVISAVQAVIQLDRAAGDPEGELAEAYHNLGHHRFPRSQRTWVVVRHDAADDAALAFPGTPDTSGSLHHSLAGRAGQAAALLARCGLRTHVLQPDAASAIFTDALTPSGLSADSPVLQHLTYRVRRWPADGLLALQRVLAVAPIDSARIALTLHPVPDRPPAMTGVIDLAFAAVIEPRSLSRYLVRAVSSCDAELLPLRPGHRPPSCRDRPSGSAARIAAVSPGRGRLADLAFGGGVLSAVPAGLAIGTGENGDPVTVPLSGPSRGTRVCIAGHPALPRLLALRALAVGVRVQVVTSRPVGWLALRHPPGPVATPMTVVPPGTPPPADGTRASPWMIIDDTQSAGVTRGGAWHCAVVTAAELPTSAAALADLDMVMYERITPAALTMVSAVFGLASHALTKVPEQCLAVAASGSMRTARLRLDPIERAAVTRSLSAG